MNAWIVTWEGTSKDVDTRSIVAALNPRYGVEKVRLTVEHLYLALEGYSDDEKLSFAAKPKSNPYSARVDRYSRITCGHNPWLFARYVRNLRKVGERFEWDEADVTRIQEIEREHGL